MFKSVFPIALVGVALGGCVSTGPSGTGTDAKGSAQTGTVIVYTSLHDAGCQSVYARLATKDANGHYAFDGQNITLKGLFNNTGPGHFTVPAGEYGFVQFDCYAPRRRSIFAGRAIKAGNIWDRSGSIYETALVTFKVAPGEVIDAGSLRFYSTGEVSKGSLFTRPVNGFRIAVTPMPETALQSLSLSDPELFKARVFKPMTVPATDAKPVRSETKS